MLCVHRCPLCGPQNAELSHVRRSVALLCVPIWRRCAFGVSSVWPAECRTITRQTAQKRLSRMVAEPIRQRIFGQSDPVRPKRKRLSRRARSRTGTYMPLGDVVCCVDVGMSRFFGRYSQRSESPEQLTQTGMASPRLNGITKRLYHADRGTNNRGTSAKRRPRSQPHEVLGMTKKPRPKQRGRKKAHKKSPGFIAGAPQTGLFTRFSWRGKY